MTIPCQSVCAPWAELADLPDNCAEYGAATDVLEDALVIASDVLFELSGERFPGHCQDTIRPCGTYLPNFSAPWSTSGLVDRHYWGDVCGCDRSTRCGCNRLREVRLHGRPVATIRQVKIDGEVLDPAFYRLDDWRYLVRLPDGDGSNPGWPCCQRLDLASTEAETFEVTYTYGQPPPPAGVWAASELACQLAAARDPGNDKCKLPDNVTSVVRQGVAVTMLTLRDFLSQRQTGLYMVDLFLAAYNPGGNQRRATVISPDTMHRSRRVGT